MPRVVSLEFLLAIIYLGLLVWIKIFHFVDVDFGAEHSALVLESDLQVENCQLPDYPPFHSSVKIFLKNPPPINCGDRQFPLTFVDSDRAIYVNASAVAELKKRNSSVHDVECFYKSIRRAFKKSHGHDASVSFSDQEVVLLQPLRLL